MNNILSQKQNSAVIIFAKYPEPGKVKTRLASETGNEFAAEFYRICAEHIFKEVQKTDAQRFLFLPATDDEALIKNWAGRDFIYNLQIGNSLGEKMVNAFEVVFSAGYNSAVIIGTDIPDISSAIIESSIKNLQSYDVVVSPSDDGGDSLLGMNKLFPFLFYDIEWSTSSVLPATIDKLDKHNIDYKIQAALHDVDNLNDLKRYLQQGKSTDIHKNILSIMNEMSFEL